MGSAPPHQPLESHGGVRVVFADGLDRLLLTMFGAAGLGEVARLLRFGRVRCRGVGPANGGGPRGSERK
eukprot:2450580-Pyramimonas_sp.AAC.2